MERARAAAIRNLETAEAAGVAAARSIPAIPGASQATDRLAEKAPDRAAVESAVQRVQAMASAAGMRREPEAVPAQGQEPRPLTRAVWASAVLAREVKARAGGALVQVLARALVAAVAPRSGLG